MISRNQIINVVLSEFNLNKHILQIEKYGAGLINNTWKITTQSNAFILQRINDVVFKNPTDIEHNISRVSIYLKKNHPNYNFISPIKTKNGMEQVHIPNLGYFRLFPFLKDSATLNVVETPEQAYEAAAQFGKFTKMLSEFDTASLKITIPDFHNLSLRYKQFLAVLESGNKERIKHAEELIVNLKSHHTIVEKFEAIKLDKNFKQRVTHHDTKISNVLFNKNGKGACVIDLDTVMPGYFFSDVGDMIRTYVSPVSEEEKDFSKIEIRRTFYTALVAGYFSEMKDELTDTEKKHFLFAGQFAIYMQSLRFLTDYLNDDVYYGAHYEIQNFVRAQNQFLLLHELENNNFTNI